MLLLAFRPRYRGADLRIVDLSTVSLKGQDLAGCDLRGVDLSGRDISGADLTGARLDGATLVEADLRDTILRGASLCDVDARGARFDRSRGAELIATSLDARGGSFRGVEWPRCRLRAARLGGARMGGARLDGADLDGASFVGSELRRAVLDDAALDGADLSQIVGRRLALAGARGRFRLVGADLRGSDLRGLALLEFEMDDARLDGARVDRDLARQHAGRLRAAGWLPPVLTRAADRIEETGRGTGRLAALLDGWRIAPPRTEAAPAHDDGIDEPDDEIAEDRFAGLTFRREREASSQAWAREAAARSRAAASRPASRVVAPVPAPAAPPPAATQRLGVETLAPSEFLDAFRDGADARDAVVSIGALEREIRARSEVRERAAAAVREAANDALRKETERLRAAEEAAALAWHQRQEGLRLAEGEVQRQAAARADAEAARAALARVQQEADARADAEAARAALARVQQEADARADAEAEHAALARVQQEADARADAEAEHVRTPLTQVAVEAPPLPDIGPRLRLVALATKARLHLTLGAQVQAKETAARTLQAIAESGAGQDRARVIARHLRAAVDPAQRQGRQELLYQLDAAEAEQRAYHDEHDLAALPPRRYLIRRLAAGARAVHSAATSALNAAGRLTRALSERASDASERAASAARDLVNAASQVLNAAGRLTRALSERASDASERAASAARDLVNAASQVLNAAGRPAGHPAERARSVPAVPAGTRLPATEDERILEFLAGGDAPAPAQTGPVWGSATSARLRAFARRVQGRARTATPVGQAYYAVIAGLSAFAGRLARLPGGVWHTAPRAANVVITLSYVVATGAVAVAIAAAHGARVGAPKIAAVADVWLWTPLRDGLQRAAPRLRALLERVEVDEPEPGAVAEAEALAAPSPHHQLRTRLLRAVGVATTTAMRAVPAIVEFASAARALLDRLEPPPEPDPAALEAAEAARLEAQRIAARALATERHARAQLGGEARRAGERVRDEQALAARTRRALRGQARREEAQRRRAAVAARLDEFRASTARRADELIGTARALTLAARAGVLPALEAVLERLVLQFAPLAGWFQNVRALGTSENLRGASVWLWGADDDADVSVATLEEGLEFARRAEDRTRTERFLCSVRYLSVLHTVRTSARDRASGGASFLPHVIRRETAFATRGRRDATDAIAVARVLRGEEAQASAELVVADRQRGEASARRSLAEEVRRAQVSRETERRRRREEAEFDRLRAEAEALEERAARIGSQEHSDSAAGVDTVLLRELRAMLEERLRALREQAQRVEAARAAQNASEAEAAAQRRRRVLAAVSVGVGRFRRRLAREPLDARPGADLSGRSFDERDLAGVDLRAALLRRSTFVGADLRRADLRDADLTESDFTGARLEGARFDGACLDGAVLDQVLVTGATFAKVRAAGTQLGALRGLSVEGRQALVSGGAQTPTSAEAGGGRLALATAVLTFAVGGGFYAYGQFGPRALDAAGLEHAATEARQSGRAGDAAEAFRRLSEQASDVQSRVDYLLEGAISAEDANDRPRTLSLLEEAVAAAEGTPDFPRVLLSRAGAWQRLGLETRAATEFEALLARADISPDQAAASIVGLHQALRDAGQTASRVQDAHLLALATDPERCAFALALADAWAAADLPASARSALEAGLASIESPPERAELHLRLARATAEAGELDTALALYAALDGSTREEDARLGAAELLERAGRAEEANAMLTPLLAASAVDVRARAHLALATTAERGGQNETALEHVREALALGGVPPSVSDGARILLARLDPSAVEDLVAENPGLAIQLLLGRAQALRERGERTDARAIWVKVAEDANTTPEARVEATLAIAELQVDDGDMDGAVRRYDELLAGALVDRDTRVRVSLGRSQALLRSSRVQEAEAAYIALLAGASSETEAQCRLGLANAKELRGQTAAASELYQSVGRGQGPWALEALLALGRIRETAGDLPGAIEAYRLARGRTGADASRRTAAELALAQALQASGDDAGSATVYAVLLEAPDVGVRVQARIAVAEAQLAADPTRARELLEAALAEAVAGPERNAARALWVRASVAAGDAAGARARLDAWLATEGDRGSQDSLAAASIRALRTEGQIEAAAEVATRWADVGFEAGMEGALSLREAGRLAEAVRVLKALAPQGTDDRRWRDEVYAELLVEADDLDAADEVWARLQRTDPDAATLGRARIARMRGEPERALTLLADTRDARAAEERGLALEELERWDEALSAYASMASSSDLERRSAAQVGQARVWLARDDARAALAALAPLSIVDPGYTLTVGQLKGDALLALKRFDEARDVYAALDGDAEARTVGALGLGECALAAGDPRTALSHFGEALRETSDRYYQADALAGLVRAFAEAGRGDQAAAQFETLQDGYPERLDAIARAQSALNE
ncbi:MAG: hypothetical protein EXR72_17070 [Myxococcales bacterium]|nr:hypothetical protein [Myxococcales bacterium]